MIYRLNNEPIFKNVNMVLPISVAEECLCANTADQIKVMLSLYRKSMNSPVSDEILAEELGMSASQVADALDYWIGKGLVFEGSGRNESGKFGVDEVQATNTKKENLSFDSSVSSLSLKSTASAKQSVPVAEKTEPTQPKILSGGTYSPVQNEKEQKKKVETITLNPPTQTELVRRCKESGEIRELMTTTEEKIGNQLSFTMQSTLLMLHDDYGLPVEVIALAVEYASMKKRITSRYLANLGKLWCENEIDTVDKAMEYIENANSSEVYWSQFRDITGITNPSPTKKQKDFLELWINTMKFSMEMIALAYEEMAERTGKFSFGYMNKILVNWQKEGIFTPADAAKAKQDRYEKSQKKKSDTKKNDTADEKSSASYDLDAYTKKAFANPLNILK